jgi:hypothetical protein
MQKRRKKVLTGTFSNSELVTLAVYLVGGDKKAVDTEDVAVRAHEIAPGRFSWRKYPEQINLELIRVYLSDAKNLGKGAYLTGSGRSGWKLTRLGLDWACRSKHAALEANHERPRGELRSGSVDEQRWRGELARIRGTSAWTSWSNGGPLCSKDVAEVFRIDSYATGDLVESKVTRLLSLFSKDREVYEFLRSASQALQEGKEAK